MVVDSGSSASTGPWLLFLDRVLRWILLTDKDKDKERDVCDAKNCGTPSLKTVHWLKGGLVGKAFNYLETPAAT
eukprot:scaffold73959_cov21-Cyclotella_meneghiniana.AAC.1